MGSNEEGPPPDNSALVFFFIFATFAMISTLFVLIHIGKTQNLKDVRIMLLLFLHGTVLVEEFATLPIFAGNEGMCELMAWLRFYTGFSNILVVFFISFHQFCFLNFENHSNEIIIFLQKYVAYITFGFPFILTLLPFSTHSYGESNRIWCTLPLQNETANNWAIGIFYSWGMLFLVASFIQLCYTMGLIFKFHLSLKRRLFLSVGAYIFIALICWLPRIIASMVHAGVDYDASNRVVLNMSFTLYVSGFLYCIVYVLDVWFLFKDRAKSAMDALPVDSFEIQAHNLENILGIELGSAENSRSNPIHNNDQS